MTPMMSAPATGTSTTHGPSVLSAGDVIAVLKCWKKNRFVQNAISFRRTSATNAQTIPIGIAIRLIVRTRGAVVKSPSDERSVSGLCTSGAPPGAMLGVVEEHDRFA